MPQVVRPTKVTISNCDDGVGRLEITLELNINLTTDGTRVAAVPPEPRPQGDDQFAFEIPDFGGGETVDFGKKV